MQLYAVPTVLVIYYLFIIRDSERERERERGELLLPLAAEILRYLILSKISLATLPPSPLGISLSLTTCIKQCNFKLFFPLLFRLQLLVALTLTLASDSPRAKQHSQSVLFLLLFLLPSSYSPKLTS